MLDGKRYYAVFPDETPEIWLRMRSLLGLLKKLENEFRQPSEQFRVKRPTMTAAANLDSRNHRPNCGHD